MKLLEKLWDRQMIYGEKEYICMYFIQTFPLVILKWENWTGKHLEMDEGAFDFSVMEGVPGSELLTFRARS